MRGRQNQIVIKLHFPDGKLNNLNVREAIHSYYKAEIINYEFLIIQVRFILATYTLAYDIIILN